jgi:flavin-binding protein dodecin
MADSVYKVIELVGTSTESWEKAAAVAMKTGQVGAGSARCRGQAV